jgi:uncharacterized repeat protein (TIGR01451 family)
MRHTIRNRFLVALALIAASLLFVTLGSAAPRPAAATADLRITKSDAPDPVGVGAQLTYAIGVENRGPSPATGVTVTDNLANDVSLVSAVGPSGACAVRKTKLTCAIGALNPAGVVYGGAPVSITIVVVPRKTGTLRNTATVAGDQKDPARANNQATATTTILGAPTCRGVVATVTGSPGDDRLTGTAGPDVIVALGGSDFIDAGSGRDLVCAGSGRDRVLAGSGSDRVFAGAGGDRVRGQGGPDLLKGAGGNDVLKGGRGSDRLRGGRGFDRCRGGAGVNSIRGCER